MLDIIRARDGRTDGRRERREGRRERGREGRKESEGRMEIGRGGYSCKEDRLRSHEVATHLLSMILQRSIYFSPSVAWGLSMESKVSNAS